MHSRPLFRTLMISVGLGLLFASFYAVQQRERAIRILAGGAVTGVCIGLAITLLERFLEARIERLPDRWRVPAKALEFLVGGLAGWIAGMSLSSYLFGYGIPLGALLRGNWALTTSVTAAVTVVVGLSFYGYDLLQRRLERTIEELKQREWAEKEIELARSIQTRLLPPQQIDGEGYTISSRNLPAQFVAGDFYDVLPLDDGSIAIVAADVAGKGLGASLIMASVKAVLPFVVREGPQRAMSMLNAKLLLELGRREFVALALARFVPADGTVELVNAGFPDPYVVSRGQVRALVATGERLPLGLRRDVSYDVLRATVGAGERLVFISDGIPEAPVAGDPLGYDRVAELLGMSSGVDDFLDRVRAVVDEGLADDWTVVVVQRA